jgi:hypothetical protein
VKNNIVKTVPKRLEMPYLIVYRVAKNLERKIIVHNGLGKNLVNTPPAQVADIRIIPDIIGIIQVHERGRKTSVIGSQDGQEKNENEGPILGDKPSEFFSQIPHHSTIGNLFTILLQFFMNLIKKDGAGILPGTVREGRFPVSLRSMGKGPARTCQRPGGNSRGMCTYHGIAGRVGIANTNKDVCRCSETTRG